MLHPMAYIHAISMAFVGAVKSTNFVLQMIRRWRLKWRQLTDKKLIHLGVLLKTGWVFIVPSV